MAELEQVWVIGESQVPPQMGGCFGVFVEFDEEFEDLVDFFLEAARNVPRAVFLDEEVVCFVHCCVKFQPHLAVFLAPGLVARTSVGLVRWLSHGLVFVWYLVDVVLCDYLWRGWDRVDVDGVGRWYRHVGWIVLVVKRCEVRSFEGS